MDRALDPLFFHVFAKIFSRGRLKELMEIDRTEIGACRKCFQRQIRRGIFLNKSECLLNNDAVVMLGRLYDMLVGGALMQKMHQSKQKALR